MFLEAKQVEAHLNNFGSNEFLDLRPFTFSSVEDTSKIGRVVFKVLFIIEEVEKTFFCLIASSLFLAVVKSKNYLVLKI